MRQKKKYRTTGTLTVTALVIVSALVGVEAWRTFSPKNKAGIKHTPNSTENATKASTGNTTKLKPIDRRKTPKAKPAKLKLSNTLPSPIAKKKVAIKTPISSNGLRSFIERKLKVHNTTSYLPIRFNWDGLCGKVNKKTYQSEFAKLKLRDINYLLVTVESLAAAKNTNPIAYKKISENTFLQGFGLNFPIEESQSAQALGIFVCKPRSKTSNSCKDLTPFQYSRRRKNIFEAEGTGDILYFKLIAKQGNYIFVPGPKSSALRIRNELLFFLSRDGTSRRRRDSIYKRYRLLDSVLKLPPLSVGRTKIHAALPQSRAIPCRK